MRLIRTGLVVLSLTALASCGQTGQTTSAGRATSSPAGSSDRQVAESALLKASDLPAGWKAEFADFSGSASGTEEEGALNPREQRLFVSAYSKCLATPTLAYGDAATPASAFGYEDEETYNHNSVVSSVRFLSDLTNVASTVSALAGSALPACLQKTVSGDLLGELQRSTPDEHFEVKATFETTPFSAVGDNRVAIRSFLSFRDVDTDSEPNWRGFTDTVWIGQGRTLVTLIFSAEAAGGVYLQPAIDSASEEQLAKIVVRRLTGGGK